MSFTILIGGRAGEGVAQAAEILGKLLTRYGFYVFNYRDYPSLIRGGHNFNVLTFDKEPVYSQEEKADIMLALNQETIELHSKKLKRKGIIFCEKGVKSKKCFEIDTDKILGEIRAEKIVKNSIFLGAI